MGTFILLPRNYTIKGSSNFSNATGGNCNGKCACGKCKKGRRIFNKRRAKTIMGTATTQQVGFNNFSQNGQLKNPDVGFKKVDTISYISYPKSYYAPVIPKTPYFNCCGG